MSSSVSSRAYLSRLRWSCLLDHGQRRRSVAIAATTCLVVGSSTKRPPADTNGPHRHRGEGPIADHFENFSLTEAPRSLTDSPTSLALALIWSVAPSALSSWSSVMSPMVSSARPPGSSTLFWNLSSTPIACPLHGLLCCSHAAMLRIVPCFALYATSPADRRSRNGYARASQLCSCFAVSGSSAASDWTTGTMASRNWWAQRRMSESVISLASNPVPATGLG